MEDTPALPTGRPKVGPGSMTARSPVDGRSAEARRHRRLCASIIDHLGHEPTEAEQALVERAAALQVRMDGYIDQVQRGEPTDTREWCRIGNAMLNALDALGVTPLNRRHRWG